MKSILRILIVHRAHADSEKGHTTNGINPSVSLSEAFSVSVGSLFGF